MKKIVLVLLTLAINVSDADAGCRCPNGGNQGTSDAFNQSVSVFSGKVIQIEEVVLEREYKKKDKMFKVNNVQKKSEIKVERIWKGLPEGSDKVYVYTGIYTHNCDYKFSKDKSYLVYAIKNYADKLTTSLCMRTKEIPENYVQIQQEINELNKLK